MASSDSITASNPAQHAGIAAHNHQNGNLNQQFPQNGLNPNQNPSNLPLTSPLGAYGRKSLGQRSVNRAQLHQLDKNGGQSYSETWEHKLGKKDITSRYQRHRHRQDDQINSHMKKRRKDWSKMARDREFRRDDLTDEERRRR